MDLIYTPDVQAQCPSVRAPLPHARLQRHPRPLPNVPAKALSDRRRIGYLDRLLWIFAGR